MYSQKSPWKWTWQRCLGVSLQDRPEVKRGRLTYQVNRESVIVVHNVGLPFLRADCGAGLGRPGATFLN